MSLNCGIVGLPNVGKSTIFKALTSAPAEAANYPFCTIEPNVGIVALTDERQERIAKIVGPEKVIPTVVEFVDIAGLVKGASKGEGLGNQFLGHIRQVDAIAHIVRCFDDTDIVHVNGKIDPLSDIETINIELALADLEVVDRKKDNMPKILKSQNKEIVESGKMLIPILDKLKVSLSDGIAVRNMNLEPEEKILIKELNLITAKPIIYVCNVDENNIEEDNDYTRKVAEYAKAEGCEVIKICGKIEAEIASLETIPERKEFMAAIGIKVSGLDVLARKTYNMLGLCTYFTAGVKEVRAWTFKKGMKAPEAAGVIHTDFQKGFIKAEIYHCEDLFKFGSEAKVKEAGKYRVEGKEYDMKDGDVVFFKFNV
jgi:GTP-binding protein YchF